MNEEFLKELENGIVDRLGNALLKNDEYNQALTKEKAAYQWLVKVLTEEQKEMLEEYCNSVSKSTLLLQKTAYKQGIADLTTLLISNEELITEKSKYC